MKKNLKKIKATKLNKKEMKKINGGEAGEALITDIGSKIGIEEDDIVDED